MNRVILMGNPNTGKTTLFNSLTKSHEKASNWHGVTVEVKTKKYKFENTVFEVCDLPGVYSLNGYSKEEKIANDFLKQNKNSLVVNICDANNLERNIILTLDLIKNGYNILLAVNMCNENHQCDYAKLSKSLGIKIIQIDARKNKSVDVIKSEILDYYSNQKTQKTLKTIKKLINSDEIIKNIAKNHQIDPYKKSDKIDKFVLNKFIFLPLFLFSILSVFYITFGPIGSCFSNILSIIFNLFISLLRKIFLCINIQNIIFLDFFFDGILGAVSSVVGFVPQIVMLVFFLNLLEDIGFMSRVAFMFDGALKKIGLSGKALFSLMMGFGCTTSAVLVTRNLENKKLRKRTVLLLPFMSCSAKLPVFLVVASLFFEKYKFLFVFLLYVFGVVVSVIFASISKKIIKDDETFFILEMPKYRFPNFKKILTDVWVTICDFFVKIGTIILFFSSIVWFLQNFSYDFKYLNGDNFTSSLLYFISSKVAFIFAPLKINSPGVVCALLLGIVAKEMVVVGLAMINGVAGVSAEALSLSLLSSSSICYFTKTTSVIFLIFILLYSPCLSAISTIKNELGGKTAAFVFFFQFALSYFVSFFVLKFIESSVLRFAFYFILFLDILLFVVLKLGQDKKCWGNCNACRKTCVK